MSKITFADKVSLNENTSIANINKLSAENVNEIKKVINENDDKFIKLSKDWIIISNNSVNLTTLDTTVTIDLIDDWSNYKQILIEIGFNNRESQTIIFYPSLNKKMSPCSVIAMANYYLHTYIGLGTSQSDTTATKKVFCTPREISGYNLTDAKIIAVYGKNN